MPQARWFLCQTFRWKPFFLSHWYQTQLKFDINVACDYKSQLLSSIVLAVYTHQPLTHTGGDLAIPLHCRAGIDTLKRGGVIQTKARILICVTWEGYHGTLLIGGCYLGAPWRSAGVITSWTWIIDFTLIQTLFTCTCERTLAYMMWK